MSHNGSADRSRGRSDGSASDCTAGHLTGLPPACRGTGVLGHLAAVFDVAFSRLLSDIFVMLVGVQDRLGGAGGDTDDQEKTNGRLHRNPIRRLVTIDLR